MDAVAEKLRGAMHGGGWCANLSTSEDELVVFAGRVIKYPRDDVAAYRAAQDYARSMGVPEHQLNWRPDLG